MYRRRRLARAQVAFGFDSFLDLVANVIGIILRLILVAWVGGRSYHALMQWRELPPEPAPAAHAVPQRDDDPLAGQIVRMQQELTEARARLLAQMRDAEVAQERRAGLEAQLVSLAASRAELAEQEQRLSAAGGDQQAVAKLMTLSLAEMRKRHEELRTVLKEIEARPPAERVLRYRTPVSRTVHADEAFFECKGGRVTFLDIAALMQEVHAGLEQKADALRTTFRLEETTRPVGMFRLRYVVERERDPLDDLVAAAKPRSMFNFRYGVSAWVAEPIDATRGETAEAAVRAGSAFRRVIDGLDGATVVTLWVYPDSFELFRTLRDHLHERGLEVAGRPLPQDAPIAASRHGSASRGQ
jgi:hypothetical protein